ncbi:MAG: hypothetical protein R6W73_03340 [Candidatus Saliniplasma sp.]
MEIIDLNEIKSDEKFTPQRVIQQDEVQVVILPCDILTYQIWRFLRNKFLFILTFVADWKVLPTVLA